MSPELPEEAIAKILTASWFPASPLEDDLTIQVLDSGDNVLAEQVIRSGKNTNSTGYSNESGADDKPF